MQISSISSLTTSGLQSLSKTSSTTSAASSTTSSESIGESFSQILDSLNESQTNADTLLTQLASGEDVDIADLMIATTENDVNFRVAMAIRDKLVDAYRQINQMSV